MKAPKLYNGIYLVQILLLISACTGRPTQLAKNLPIENAIFNEKGFYATDFSAYNKHTGHLPIGVFDSGTGGLTILDALLDFDECDNDTQSGNPDGVPDFTKEKFIYLADQANMPYGNYYSTSKSDLLIEHVLKDAQFLLSDKYYQEAASTSYQVDKKPVKIIIIACNTATAYGKEHIEALIKKTGKEIKVIGVIDAGARGALEALKQNENGSIGVMATVGTIASDGYEKALMKIKVEKGYSGDVMVFNQGGYGLAEAVDEEVDFIDANASFPRQNYRGPAWKDLDYTIDKALWDVYNFNQEKNNLLCNSNAIDDCELIQLNSTENYVRYHLVSLMEKIRKAPNAQPLKVLLLGCTHYPYLSKEISTVLNELYHYKKDGAYLYRSFMAEDIKLIDPSINVARELHAYMKSRDIFSKDNSMNDSEFYISIPNIINPNVVVDSLGRFTYDYKYGRKAGEIQEYVKVVPFSKQNISGETLARLQRMLPLTFDLVSEFIQNNRKTEFLRSPSQLQVKSENIHSNNL